MSYMQQRSYPGLWTVTDTIASVLVITVTTVEAHSDASAYTLKTIRNDTCL